MNLTTCSWSDKMFALCATLPGLPWRLGVTPFLSWCLLCRLQVSFDSNDICKHVFQQTLRVKQYIGHGSVFSVSNVSVCEGVLDVVGLVTLVCCIWERMMWSRLYFRISIMFRRYLFSWSWPIYPLQLLPEVKYIQKFNFPFWIHTYIHNNTTYY